MVFAVLGLGSVWGSIENWKVYTMVISFSFFKRLVVEPLVSQPIGLRPTFLFDKEGVGLL